MGSCRCGRRTRSPREVALTTSRRRSWPAPVAIGLFAAAVGFIGSWHVSLWTDEAATISSGRRSLPDLWREVQQVDAVHGLYYLFMHGWIGLFGWSAVSVRLPSALAVGVAAAGVCALASRLAGDRNVGILGGLIFALLPRVTWMGIEARSFAFTAVGAVGLTALLLRAARTGGVRWWTAYTLLAALCVALDIYLVLFLIAQGPGVFLDRGHGRRTRSSWVACGVAALVLASPVLFLAHRESGQLGATRVGAGGLLRQVLVNQWFLGATPTSTSGVTTVAGAALGIARYWQAAAVVLAVLSWCVIAAGLFTRPARAAGGADRRRVWLGVLLPWIGVPTVLLAVASLAGHPLYSPRYLSFATPAVAILLAIGLRSVPARWLRPVIGLALVVLIIPIYTSQRQLYGKSGTDWSSVAAFVSERKAPHEAVYFSPRVAPTGTTVRETTRSIAAAYPAAFAGLADLTLATTPAAAGNITGSSTLLSSSRSSWPTLHAVWVVSRIDYSRVEQQRDDALLTSAGFTVKLRWLGPLDSVTEFSRP